MTTGEPGKNFGGTDWSSKALGDEEAGAKTIFLEQGLYYFCFPEIIISTLWFKIFPLNLFGTLYFPTGSLKSSPRYIPISGWPRNRPGDSLLATSLPFTEREIFLSLRAADTVKRPLIGFLAISSVSSPLLRMQKASLPLMKYKAYPNCTPPCEITTPFGFACSTSAVMVNGPPGRSSRRRPPS